MSRVAIIVVGALVTAFTLASSGTLKQGDYEGDAVIIGSDGTTSLLLAVEIGSNHSAVLNSGGLLPTSPPAPIKGKWFQEDTTHFVTDFSKGFTKNVKESTGDDKAKGTFLLRFKLKNSGLKGKLSFGIKVNQQGIHVIETLKAKFFLAPVVGP